jgi:hypothetical protein
MGCIAVPLLQGQNKIVLISCVLTSFPIITNSPAVLTLMCGGFIPKTLAESQEYEGGMTLEEFQEDNF